MATSITMSENACGGATDSIDDGGIESFDCPTCGDSFSTQAGVKQHHYALHGESIAGVDIECDWCGTITTKRPSHVNEYGQNFCSNECNGKWASENLENKTGVNCDYCGDEFQIHPFRLEQSELHFCPDSECYGNWQSENAVSENARHWEGGQESVVCEMCEDSFSVRPYRSDSARFCSRQCADEFKTTITGELHPLWIADKQRDYGEKWEYVRSKARDRDNYTCQGCGVNESTMGRELDVHHIQPLRKFESLENANRLQNLICLCMSCHNKWEGIPLRPLLSD